MGLIGYYCRFIEDFSSIITSLTWLIWKETKFVWDSKCEDNFQELKHKLTTTPMLTIPDDSGGFIMYCDESHLGLSCVIMQHDRVMAYGSR